ncbi:hypothetical protein QQS21_011334 [Conoideocrella luteorostrata]|uniref:Uncharacterized protein n=1 Tax=Conoideocrella luteorostrata TaxID=1105319 RepID=A0AAJ0CDA3_9HYPO|nr:hypothetical protein QQS21_011334 [Conoideocrella luteorostrata]
MMAADLETTQLQTKKATEASDVNPEAPVVQKLANFASSTQGENLTGSATPNENQAADGGTTELPTIAPVVSTTTEGIKTNRGNKKKEKTKSRKPKSTTAARSCSAKTPMARELMSRKPLKQPPVRARAPGIPHALDDGPNIDQNDHGEATQDTEESEGSVQDAPSTEESTPIIPPTSPRQLSNAEVQEPEIVPSDLEKMPIEVRYLIWKELLVVDKHIKVHSGWELVYKRQRLCVPISILCTCRRFYAEGISILYGCNTFLYRLRDRIIDVTDVDQVALIDEPGTVLPTNTNGYAEHVSEDGEDEPEEDDDDDDDDPEWAEPETSQTRHRGSRGRHCAKQPAMKPDICVEKYFHLFRRVIIEAEKNRFGEGTKRLMASAIEAFAYKPNPLSPSLMTKIHTLTIRVAPRWDATGGEDDYYGCFTFVDFFEPDSAIIKSIESVNCEFLRVDLMTCYMDGPSARSGCRFTMDMRHACLVKHVQQTGQDPWRTDCVMQDERRQKASMATGALKSLDMHVQNFCDTFLSQKTWDENAWDAIDNDTIENGF